MLAQVLHFKWFCPNGTMHAVVECEGHDMKQQSIAEKKCKRCIDRRLEGSCEYDEETIVEFRERINLNVEEYKAFLPTNALILKT